jgi:cell division protein FtsZ
VVFNDAMKDEVKITVIATGFQRDSLPHISRRGEVLDAAHAMPGMPTQAPAAAPEPEPEPVVMARTPPPPPLVEEEPPIHDLDVPAFLRRDRRLYQ